MNCHDAFGEFAEVFLVTSRQQRFVNTRRETVNAAACLLRAGLDAGPQVAAGAKEVER